MKESKSSGIREYRGAGSQPREVKEFTQGVLEQCASESLRDTGGGGRGWI